MSSSFLLRNALKYGASFFHLHVATGRLPLASCPVLQQHLQTVEEVERDYLHTLIPSVRVPQCASCAGFRQGKELNILTMSGVF